MILLPDIFRHRSVNSVVGRVGLGRAIGGVLMSLMVGNYEHALCVVLANGGPSLGLFD